MKQDNKNQTVSEILFHLVKTQQHYFKACKIVKDNIRRCNVFTAGSQICNRWTCCIPVWTPPGVVSSQNGNIRAMSIEIPMIPRLRLDFMSICWSPDIITPIKIPTFSTINPPITLYGMITNTAPSLPTIPNRMKITPASWKTRKLPTCNSDINKSCNCCLCYVCNNRTKWHCRWVHTNYLTL